MATPDQAETPHVTVHGNAKGFAQKVELGSHRLDVDEPVSYGGTDSGASPYDLILAALGACTSMTIGLYARKRGWPLEDITISLQHSKITQRIATIARRRKEESIVSGATFI